MQASELDKELYEQAIEFERIGNRAVRKAQEESRRLGVPNVYSINGVLYYERRHADDRRSRRQVKAPYAGRAASAWVCALASFHNLRRASHRLLRVVSR